MTPSARFAVLSLVVVAGCSSPATEASPQKDETSYKGISKGMTKDMVLERLGEPRPQSKRPDIWDYELGGPQDPVYRFVFETDRVVHIKRFDGYAVVVPSADAAKAPYTLERR